MTRLESSGLEGGGGGGDLGVGQTCRRVFRGISSTSHERVAGADLSISLLFIWSLMGCSSIVGRLVGMHTGLGAFPELGLGTDGESGLLGMAGPF